MASELFDKYVEACNYPGLLDQEAATGHLQQYLKALGVEREVRQLDHRFMEDEHFLSVILDVASKVKPNALAALAARDARAAAHQLPAGTYQVTYQYDPRTMRRVSD